MKSIAITLFLTLVLPFSGAQSPQPKSFAKSRAGFFGAKATYFSSPVPGVRGAAAAESERIARESLRDFVSETTRFFDDPITRKMFRENGGKPTAPYFFQSTTQVTAFSSEVASFLVQTERYTGGAHANTSLACATFGLKDGVAVKLSWADIAEPSHNDAIKAKILERIMFKKRKWMPDASEPMLSASVLDQFVVSPGGVAWLFGQGEIGAESEGTFVAKLPWSEIAPVLRAGGPMAGFLDRHTVFSTWELVEFQGMDDTVRLLPEGHYTLTIAPDGRVSGRVDVNRFTGAAKVDGTSLTIEVQTTTRAMPPEGSYHDRFLRDLGDVRSAVLKGDDLFLSLKADGGIMRFRRIVEGSSRS